MPRRPAGPASVALTLADGWEKKPPMRRASATLAVWWMLHRTDMGKAVRASAEDASMARAFGMKVAAYDPYVTDWPDLATRVTDLTEGLRAADAGFDQILRSTEAGRQWREAVMRAAYPAAGNAVTRLTDRAAAALDAYLHVFPGKDLPALRLLLLQGRVDTAKVLLREFVGGSAGAAAFRAQGQEHHLSLPVGWPLAPRSLRSQAGAHQA